MSEELKCPYCEGTASIAYNNLLYCHDCKRTFSERDAKIMKQAARIAELEAERDRLRKALRGLMQAVDGCLTPSEALLWKKCEEAMKGSEIGQRGGKTHWLGFMKEGTDRVL